MLMLGREVTQPVDIMFGTVVSGTHADESDYVTSFLGKLNLAHQTARENLKEAQGRQKKTYDLNLHTSHYDPGDAVFKLDSSRKVGQSPKLKHPWAGPYLVTERFSPALYRIRDRKSSGVVHHDRLKACEDRDLPIWLLRMRSGLLDTPGAISEPSAEVEPDQGPGLPEWDPFPGDEETPRDTAPVEDDSVSGIALDPLEVTDTDPDDGEVELTRCRRRPAWLSDYLLN
ncbi:uncharacterized protein [Argopecten irradians]|uniref:uncharacterized protein n=1 Tax=Argopecten irradians TaxID=31199 RepID=UPI0037105BF3